MLSITDASTYAHFLFNAFDTDHNGSVSFEVSAVFFLRFTDSENWHSFGQPEDLKPC